MARICKLCGKKPISGNAVTKRPRENPKYVVSRSKRRWLPNLQRVRVQTESGPRRIRICTKCLRSGKVNKIVSRMSDQL